MHQKRRDHSLPHNDAQGKKHGDSGAHKDSANVISYNEYVKQRANFDDPSKQKKSEAERLKLEKARAENKEYLKNSR
jgi:hypothetical protein